MQIMVGEVVKVFSCVESVLTEMLTVKQAAYRYNFHVRTIRKWCDEGKLIALKIDNLWLIPIPEIEAFLKRNDALKEK